MALVPLITYILTSFQLTYGLEGRLFYLTFMNTTYVKGSENYPTLQEIFITSSVTGFVTIKYGEPLNYEDIITLNSANNWQYGKRIAPTNIARPLNTISNSAIIVSSTMDISVQVNKAEGTGTGEGYLALPITSNSKLFYLASFSQVSSQWSTQLSVVSTFNDTVVRVMNSHTEVSRFKLSAGEVYQDGMLSPNDYTGYYITSTRPVAVFSGHACASVPTGIGYCDPLVEQIPPVSQWGKTFIMASFHGRPYAVGFIVRVIAQSDIMITYSVQRYDNNSNPLELEIFRTKNITAGQWDETAINDTRNAVVVLINCSDDCLVMQYNLGLEALGRDRPGETAKPDPFMVTVPALSHYTNDVRFSTSHVFNNVSVLDLANGVTIVVQTADLSKVYLDNQLVTGIGGKQYELKANALTSYTVIIAPLSPGFHSVTTSDSTVKYAVFVYGHGMQSATSYGYLAGYGYIYGTNDRPITKADIFGNRYTSPQEAARHTAAQVADPAAKSSTTIVTVVLVGLGIVIIVAIVAFVVVKRRNKSGASGGNTREAFNSEQQYSRFESCENENC